MKNSKVPDRRQVEDPAGLYCGQNHPPSTPETSRDLSSAGRMTAVFRIKDYTWHCNRRTFASRLVMEGVDIRTVAQLMGHSTIQMTMRYSHLAPEHSQTAVERLVPSRQLVTKSVTTRKRQKAVRQ